MDHIKLQCSIESEIYHEEELVQVRLNTSVNRF